MKNDLTFEEETRREKIRDAFTSPLVAACLIFFLQVLLGALQGRILPADTESTTAYLAKILIPLLFSGLAVFLPFAVYNRMVEESLKPVFEKKRLQVRPGLFLAGIAAVCGLGILFRYFAMLLTSAMEDVGFVFIRNIPPTDHPFFFILFSALIPALFFELAFRGIMLERLREWSPAAAVVLSAVVYAFSYMSLDIIPHALVCGLLLGWLYLKTGSILLSFAASAVTNGIIAWLWLSETLSPTVAITCGIVGAAAAVICFLLTKDTPKVETNGYSRKEILRGVFTSFSLYTLLVITFLGLMFYHIDKPDPDAEPQQQPTQGDNPYIIWNEKQAEE